MAIAFLGTILLAAALSHVLPSPSNSMLRVYITLAFLLPSVFWPLIIETLTHGRSIGKWLHGLQVVRDDGGVISFRHSLTRVIAGILELWLTFGGIALISSVFNNRAKRLGDFMAGTMVIAIPEPQHFPAVLMPPDAQSWANNAQLVPLPTELSQRALMFLRNARQVSPLIRYDHALALSRELLTFVEPAPPEWLHPERFIAAVLVLNRDRDIQTLRRWEQQRVCARAIADAHVFGISSK